MDNQEVTYIAIDISKNTLRVQTPEVGFDVANTPAGIRTLLRRTAKLNAVHFICEASGGYERILIECLHQKALRVTLVSAARVRDFARSEGIKAKTDPIDARVILRYGQEKHPQPTLPPSPQRQKLVDLVDRREHLTEQLKREKTRLQKPGVAREINASIDRMIRLIEKEIQKIEQAIRELVQDHEPMRQAHAVLLSIKGIGEVSAWTLMAYLPEITSSNRNQIAALAGLAPYNRDTGNSLGIRRVEGGRAKVRRCLYLAATTAARHNEVIKPYVATLRARGKPYKCAIVAAMRKILIYAQSLLKKHEICLA